MSDQVCAACHGRIAKADELVRLVRDRHALADERPRRERGVVRARHEGHAKRDGWRRAS